jgi:hypothetical protein
VKLSRWLRKNIQAFISRLQCWFVPGPRYPIGREGISAVNFFSKLPEHHSYFFIHILSTVSISYSRIMPSPITCEYKGKIAVITIDKDNKLNALNQDEYYLIARYMREIATHDEVFITVLTGKGILKPLLLKDL